MGNGITQNSRLRELSEAANQAVNCIKINSITFERRQGKPTWVKRRRWGSELIAGQANLFFRLAQGRVHVWVDPKKWQPWEIYCFRLLQEPRFRAFAEGSRTVCMDAIPGMHLCEHLKHGTLTTGDLDNVVYDGATNRARLIDFEVLHDQSLPAVLRHADDLLVFLQDLVCRVSTEQWLPFALCFIKAYGRAEVIAELTRLLFVPAGLPGLWWKLRTENFERRELTRRVDALRRALLRTQDANREGESLEFQSAA